jgi:hypothetical protein
MIDKFDVTNETFVFKGHELDKVAAWNCCTLPKTPDVLHCLVRGDILISMSKPYRCPLHVGDGYCVDFLHPVHGMITLHGRIQNYTYGGWHKSLDKLK